jgi:hypothetical protein
MIDQKNNEILNIFKVKVGEKMLMFFVLMILWPLVVMILGTFIVRLIDSDYPHYANPYTTFVKGFAFGPIAIMAALTGKVLYVSSHQTLALGGILGTICFIYTLQQF